MQRKIRNTSKLCFHMEMKSFPKIHHGKLQAYVYCSLIISIILIQSSNLLTPKDDTFMDNFKLCQDKILPVTH